MDTIIKSYLDNFINKFGIENELSESKRFEYFSIFSILSDEINSNIDKNDLEEIIMPDGIKGIDGIAITINGRLILNSDEIENFENQNLIVNFYFFQAKTTDNFSDTEVANFLDTIIDFFSDYPQYNNYSEYYRNYIEIYKELKKNIGLIREFNLYCYYITLGTKQLNETSIDYTLKVKENDLKNYSLFSMIDIELIDKSTLISKHKKAIAPLKAKFEFVNKITLSNIPNVDEAYIGFVPFKEFKKLILDEDQNKIKSLFNDNLRDFLGFDNPINKNIKSTLDNGKFSQFSLLNNGITVIAENNSGKGNTLVLENYQIVNGCQTSNVLYECKNIDGIDDVLIPLKVIITKNETLRDEIIVTTNSQSSFTEEQLFAITEFQKTLEDYYNSQKNIDGIYYERRTNQYSGINISRISIIDIKEQLKSFMAMFFEIPHLVSANIGKVISKSKNQFFQKNHSCLPYYISGLLSKKWEILIQSNSEYKEFNKFRYHIFMGIRYLVEDLPFNEKYLENYKSYSIKSEQSRINSYEKLLKVLRNEEILKKYIKQAIEIFQKVDYKRPKSAYSGLITDEYKKLLQDYINSSN